MTTQDAGVPMRPLGRAEWLALGAEAAEKTIFTEHVRCLLAVPVAFALTGPDVPPDINARLAIVEAMPFGAVLDARDRLVALSITDWGDS